MRRDIAEPIDTRGLEWNVGVETTGNGLVDDGLLLFGQQFDQPLLGTDVALNTAVDVVEVADDGGLFSEGWNEEQP